MASNSRVLVIGADGLRPDQIDPDIMPTVSKLANRGVQFSQHRAMYPSHTRVNMTSLATGTTAGAHGIVANTMLVPFATPDHIIQTSDFQHLDALDNYDPNGAQLTKTMSQYIHESGHRFGMTGNGSTGSNVLWTFKNRGRLINPDSAYGIADLYDLREKLGEIPDRIVPMTARNEYCTSAVTDIFLPDPEIRAMTIWMVEPDAALHKFGIGSPEVREAMAGVDRCVARMVETIQTLGIEDQVDILFASDHGHTTVNTHKTLREFLQDAANDIQGGLPQLATASDYIYAEPGTNDPQPAQMAPLVDWLYEQPWVDLVLGNESMSANIPGVISLKEIWGQHTNSRAPLLAVSPAWNSEPNEFGAPGQIAALTTQSALRSSHGSLSPWDMQPTLIGYGPSFREGVISKIPTGAIDVTPTVMSILGMPVPQHMDGRVLHEGLLNFDAMTHEVETYHLHVERQLPQSRSVKMAKVGNTRYIQGSNQELLVI